MKVKFLEHVCPSREGRLSYNHTWWHVMSIYRGPDEGLSVLRNEKWPSPGEVIKGSMEGVRMDVGE